MSSRLFGKESGPEPFTSRLSLGPHSIVIFFALWLFIFVASVIFGLFICAVTRPRSGDDLGM